MFLKEKQILLHQTDQKYCVETADIVKDNCSWKQLLTTNIRALSFNCTLCLLMQVY